MKVTAIENVKYEGKIYRTGKSFEMKKEHAEKAIKSKAVKGGESDLSLLELEANKEEALKKAGLVYIEDLMKTSDDVLVKIKGITKDDVKEIREILGELEEVKD